MNISSGFFAQQNIDFSFEINEIYKYKSGILNFISNGLNNDYCIYFKNNAIFDKNENLIFSIDPFYKNNFSGHFNSGTFETFYLRDVQPIALLKSQNNNLNKISGFVFDLYEKEDYVNDIDYTVPAITINKYNNPIYSIEWSGGEFTNSNLYFKFKFSEKNLDKIVINSIELKEYINTTSYKIQELSYPIIINPGEDFNFYADSLYEPSSRQKYININLHTDGGIIEYDFNLLSLSGPVNNIDPYVNTYTNISYINNGDISSNWFFEINNALNLDSIYFEISGLDNYNDTLYRNLRSSNIFGQEPAAYVNMKFNDIWGGRIFNAFLTGKNDIVGEDFGNIRNLKAFSWTNNWDDSLFLNESNQTAILLNITGLNFILDDINVYLYSKNNTSGLLDLDLIKLSKSDNYKNTLINELGWDESVLSNCCGNSGLPSGFPSGFPFVNQNKYGFFSGFGFGKMFGYIMTGNSIYNILSLISKEDLSLKNSEYHPPISTNQNIKINTNWNLLGGTGFYVLKFKAKPDTSLENESGIFWPKMWPSRASTPNDIYDSGKYFYKSGFEMSGNYYSGSGINLIKTLISNDTGMYFSGIDYNPAIGINQFE